MNRILYEFCRIFNYANLYRRSSLKFRALVAKILSPQNSNCERSKIYM